MCIQVYVNRYSKIFVNHPCTCVTYGLLNIVKVNHRIPVNTCIILYGHVIAYNCLLSSAPFWQIFIFMTK